MKNKILVIDDEFLIRYTLAEGLKDRGYEAESAGSVEEGLEKMKTFGPEVILLDNLLENSRGMDEIPAFRKLDENVQVIMMTAYGSVSQAVEAIKQGAYDYVLKPFDIDEIEIIISRSLESVRNRESLEFLKGQTKEFLGSSESAIRIRSDIALLGENSSVSVMIRGETGTGKEVVARLIHESSDRRDHLMVRINCGAIPENLMESELFGYEKGAFTGAVKSKKGLFELADGVPGRDRGAAAVHAGEASDVPGRQEIQAGGRLKRHRRGRAGPCGHQPRSGEGGGGKTLPRGLVLPPQRHTDRDSSPAAEAGGHQRPLRLLPGLLQ